MLALEPPNGFGQRHELFVRGDGIDEFLELKSVYGYEKRQK